MITAIAIILRRRALLGAEDRNVELCAGKSGSADDRSLRPSTMYHVGRGAKVCPTSRSPNRRTIKISSIYLHCLI